MADTHRRERDRLRARIKQLEQEKDDLFRVVGWIDPKYAAALIDLADIACHRVYRPADLGGPIKAGHLGSTPPSNPQQARAYDAIRQDRVKQRARADELRRIHRRLIDGLNADEAPQAVRPCA